MEPIFAWPRRTCSFEASVDPVRYGGPADAERFFALHWKPGEAVGILHGNGAGQDVKTLVMQVPGGLASRQAGKPPVAHPTIKQF